MPLPEQNAHGLLPIDLHTAPGALRQILNEQQFRYSIQTLAKMYDLREREAEETAWANDLRGAILGDSDAAIRHVERWVIQYVLDNYGQSAPPAPAESAREIVEPELAEEAMRQVA